MEQGQDLGGAAADGFMRLGGRVFARLPGWAGMRHGLKRPRLVLAPDRQPKLGAQRVGLLDQPLFTILSGSTRVTVPCLRRRMTTPVWHQVRLFCQLSPAACRVRQIVSVLTCGSPSGAWRKALWSRLKDHVAVPSWSRCGVRAHSVRMRCCASAP